MANILISPGKYVQGAGEMKNLGKYAEKYGKKALVIITASGYKRCGAAVEEGFRDSGAELVFDYFNGECSKKEISRLTAVVEKENCDMVIGIGGGKILDTAKAVAYYKSVPVLVCPTIASTDAPCSALSVIYTDEGVFEEYLFLPANPNMVLMDTEIIAKSPVRLTVSGMGDALATYFEARACQRSGAVTCAGGKVTSAAMALAKLCFDTLMDEGVKAKLALEAGACTPAVEKIIEANHAAERHWVRERRTGGGTCHPQRLYSAGGVPSHVSWRKGRVRNDHTACPGEYSGGRTGGYYRLVY